MSQYAMGRHCGPMITRCLDELAEPQGRKRALHGAFGKSGFIGQHAQACFDWLPVLAGSAAGKKQIDEKRRWLLTVSDEITHEHV